MSILEEQINASLLPEMYIPEECSFLFKWIEDNKYYIDGGNKRLGFLYPYEESVEQRNDEEIIGGTVVAFSAEGNTNLHHWFGHDRPEVINRLCVFASTGGEGSMAAFWIDDEGNQKIVHLGSGSGSTLVCEIAKTPLDFLRLIGIGYEEICWNVQFDQTPSEAAEEEDMIIHPNTQYQNWVITTFKTTIPPKASLIVQYPSEMADEDSNDKFWQWVNNNT